jgi:hypothetical protein
VYFDIQLYDCLCSQDDEEEEEEDEGICVFDLNLLQYCCIN